MTEDLARHSILSDRLRHSNGLRRLERLDAWEAARRLASVRASVGTSFGRNTPIVWLEDLGTTKRSV